MDQMKLRKVIAVLVNVGIVVLLVLGLGPEVMEVLK